MIKRNASAVWNGNLKEGNGGITTQSGVMNQTKYSFATRFENGEGTNPEELLSAAHAACFSMDFANRLSNKGYSVGSIKTSDFIHLEKENGGFKITKIVMVCEANVKDIDNEILNSIGAESKTNCIVSKALAAIPMELEINQI
jgi:lipoyl-dependent peroxiredoxin